MRPLNRLWMQWSAWRNGRTDGARLIPDGLSPAGPPHLRVLEGWGSKVMGRVGLRWQRIDQKLHPVYRRRVSAWQQRLDDVDRAEREAAHARERFERRPTYEYKVAWRKLDRRAAKARRRAEAALKALDGAIARRQARFRSVLSEAEIITAEVRRLMQIYVTANVRAREGHEIPPGLRDDGLPPMALPDSLRELRWDPPLIPQQAAGGKRGGV